MCDLQNFLGEGIRNVVRVSMRDAPAKSVLKTFAYALGIDTSQGSHCCFKAFQLDSFIC